MIKNIITYLLGLIIFFIGMLSLYLFLRYDFEYRWWFLLPSLLLTVPSLNYWQDYFNEKLN